MVADKAGGGPQRPTLKKRLWFDDFFPNYQI